MYSGSNFRTQCNEGVSLPVGVSNCMRPIMRILLSVKRVLRSKNSRKMLRYSTSAVNSLRGNMLEVVGPCGRVVEAVDSC